MVLPGVPLHVTQRGNHRERVFFHDRDCLAYLALLREYAVKHELRIVAYCLMANHVHLVAVPGSTESLHRVLKPVHSRYAQRINRERKMHGHLWQGRYFSALLDEDYFRAAVRYVELNPVRAGIVARAEDYPWSSASSRCEQRRNPVLAPAEAFAAILPPERDWRTWLQAGENADQLSKLRSHTGKNLPCGSEVFVEHLEERAGMDLRLRPRGGQPRTLPPKRERVLKGSVPSGGKRPLH